jgi:predicted DNA-binding transcriptional regulator YafY
MAKRSSTPTPEPLAVTKDRAIRLCRLLRLLGSGKQTRADLLRSLAVDVRGFYRDLATLRAHGIDVELKEGHYLLKGKVAAALNRVPLPDPHLTLGEALQLSKGRSGAHRKLKALLDEVLPPESPPPRRKGS